MNPTHYVINAMGIKACPWALALLHIAAVDDPSNDRVSIGIVPNLLEKQYMSRTTR